jgi:hypothetical protein
MEDAQRKYEDVVVQGWVGMLFLLLLMFITDLIEQAINGSFQNMAAFLAKDPGITGLWVLTGLICTNVLVQISVRSFHGKACRKIIFILTIGYAVFFLLHQIIHLINGEGFDIHFMIDITHNILGAWASWAAYQLAYKTEYGVL